MTKDNRDNKDTQKNIYKDINNYKPEGKLIYNNDLLKKLTIND